MTEIDDYLRANRDAYTRDVLTRRLIDQGHDPAEVEAAWERLSSVSADADPSSPARHWTASPETPLDRVVGKAGIGTIILAVTIFVGYAAAIVAAGITIAYGGAVSILMIVYVVAMVGGLYVALRRLLRAPRERSGWAPIWISVGLSVVIFVGLSGACFVGLGPAINASGGLLGGSR